MQNRINSTKEKILLNKQLVPELYKSGKSYSEIRSITGCCTLTIQRYLEYSGIKTPGSGGANRIVLENPFVEGDEKSDYWLGFLAADGNLNKSSNAITLHQKDLNVLKDYISFLGYSLRIHKGIRSASLVTFSNEEVYQYLESQGLTPNKSKTLSLRRMNRHILRGIFDGDGSVKKQCKITTGSKMLVGQIVRFLNTEDIPTYVKPKGNINICWDICIRAEYVPEFYWLLYKDATVYFKRKRNDYGYLSRKVKEKIQDELLET